MSGWAVVAIVAIVMWGIVSTAKARAGIITDEDGNESYAPRDDAQSQIANDETRRELEQLRERVAVLERIATDRGQLLADEIEALRIEKSEDSSKESTRA